MVYLQPRVLVVMFLGFSSGLPLALSGSTLLVWMREAGVDLGTIGLFALVGTPYTLKFLWAPLVDRFGTQRNWILACQLVLVVCFAVASALPPDTHLGALSGVLLVMAFVASLQDVATDSLGVHVTTEETRGQASGASTAGGYLGFLIGGGAWLPIYAYAGWAASMWVMAACIALLTLPAVAATRLGRTTHAVRLRPSFRAVLSNKTLMRGLAFLVLYQCGVRLGISMLGPFMVDAGISVAGIGWVKGAGGAVAGALASLLAACVTQRFGTGRALALFAVLNLLTSVALAAYAFGAWHAVAPMVALLLLQSVAVAMSFVALYAAMMNWCASAQVATDFAVLQSVDAILAIVMGAAAGLLGQHFGYGTIFCIAAALLALGAWRSMALHNPRPNANTDSARMPTASTAIQESIR